MARAFLLLLALAMVPPATAAVRLSNRSTGTWTLRATYFSTPVTVRSLDPRGPSTPPVTYEPMNIHQYRLARKPDLPFLDFREAHRFTLELAPGETVELAFPRLAPPHTTILCFSLADASRFTLASPLPGPDRPAAGVLEITAAWTGSGATAALYCVRCTGPAELGETDPDGPEFRIRAADFQAAGAAPGPAPVRGPAPPAPPATPGRNPPPRS